MNNNNLDQISMRSSKRAKERFNLKHGVDTSFGIGEMQPLLCKKCVAGAKNVIKVNNVVRLAPMVAPTFGQLKLHHNFAFVGMSDLIDSQVWNAYLANQPVEFAGGVTQVPQRLPFMSLQLLSAFALTGAKCSIYFDQSTDDLNDSMETRIENFVYEPGTVGASNFYSYFFNESSTAAANYDAVAGRDAASDPNLLFRINYSSAEHYGYAFKDYNSSRLNVGRLLGLSNELWLPSSNWSTSSFGYYDGVGSTSGDPDYTRNAYWKPLIDMDYVPLDKADAVLQGVALSNSSTTVHATFAFRLSDFGKRWRKLLIGLGYGFDLSCTKPKSLAKLFACYQAYFNMFGLTLYQSWETTNCAKVLAAYNNDYMYDYTSLFDSGSSTGNDQTWRRNLFAFFADCADMWYTEEQDWISAHIRTAAVSPNDRVGQAFYDMATPNVNHMGVNVDDGAIKPSEYGSLGASYDQSTGTPNGHAFINNVLHSQLDSEVLKRLYKVTNRNTIAGRRIADLLKAQGLGEYMKRQRSNFVGHSSVGIEIFDVTATADTYDITNSGGTQKGSVLGEYVGKGVGEGSSKTFKFSSPEEGFFVDLAAIVPESGWMNGADLECEDIKKLDHYNPEYDGLGFELSPKSIVCGDVPWVYDGAQSVHNMGFGFIPRYTRHKVTQNVCNGDISLRSTRDGFLPFTLNKFVDLGSRDVQDVTPNTNIPATFHGYKVTKMLTPDRLPIATVNYRYLGKFPWMGHFYRIFANIQRDRVADVGEYYQNFSSSTMDSTDAWFLLRTDDNFIVHSVFLQDYYAGMLAIEASFETHEDGNNGASDMSIGKA